MLCECEGAQVGGAEGGDVSGGGGLGEGGEGTFSRGSSSAGSAVGVPLPSTEPSAAAKALECAEASDDPDPWTSVPSTSKVISVTGRGTMTPAPGTMTPAAAVESIGMARSSRHAV